MSILDDSRALVAGWPFDQPLSSLRDFPDWDESDDDEIGVFEYVAKTQKEIERLEKNIARCPLLARAALRKEMQVLLAQIEQARLGDGDE